MFVDASAIVAILAREPDADHFGQTLARATVAYTSAVAIWEATIALARHEGLDPSRVLADVHDLSVRMGMREVPIGAPESRLAVQAYARFGKGRHPARLNMGDCFAYACARTLGVPLLYKGQDFALTDIEAA